MGSRLSIKGTRRLKRSHIKSLASILKHRSHFYIFISRSNGCVSCYQHAKHLYTLMYIFHLTMYRFINLTCKNLVVSENFYHFKISWAYSTWLSYVHWIIQDASSCGSICYLQKNATNIDMNVPHMKATTAQTNNVFRNS